MQDMMPNQKPTDDDDDYSVSDDELAALRRMATDYVPAVEWIGRELRFPYQTGIWLEQIGKDAEKIVAGERFVIDPKSVVELWKRWGRLPGQADKPAVTDMIGGRCLDGWINPPRSELPEADPEQWPYDPKDAKRKDPWQEETRVVLRRLSDDQLLTWCSRFAERKAIGEAVDLFTREFQQHLSRVPVFTLDSIQRGKNFHPLLVPTGDWVPFGEGASLPANPARLKRLQEDLAKVKEKYEPKVITLASAKKGQVERDAMNDEIPF